MSRMSKFLKQTCVLEHLVSLNAQGDAVYGDSITLRCRREQCVKDIEVTNGSLVKSSTRYFVDEREPVHANDRVDGKVILSVTEYTNEYGKCEGFEFYVQEKRLRD